MANFQQVVDDFFAAQPAAPAGDEPPPVRLTIKQRRYVLRQGASLPLPEAFATRGELYRYLSEWRQRAEQFMASNEGRMPMGGEVGRVRWAALLGSGAFALDD